MYLLTTLFPIINLVFVSCLFVFFKKTISQSIIFFSFIISFFSCLIILYEVIYLNSVCTITFAPWFKIGSLNIQWSFFYDKITVILLFMVICISFCVHIFALDYLKNDPHLSRFLILLYSFTLFMQILITSGNLIQLFLGWEGIGITSYLLINFWFTRYEANNSGLMAIIYNRIGDCDF